MIGVRPNSPMAITSVDVQQSALVQVFHQRGERAVERRGQTVAMALVVVAVRVPGVA